MENDKNITVISLGGSLIVPHQIDWKFIKNFRELIVSEMKKGKRFVIVTGGGYTCREYQQAAGKITQVTNEDKDWIGIHTTRLNAHLVKTIFRKYCHPRINKNPHTKENLNKHFAQGEGMMVAAGWRPGRSSDYACAVLGKRLGGKKIINLSNIKYVCDKDPKKYPDAKKIRSMDWKEFRKIVGNKWDPGLNMPFDPVAAKIAQSNKMELVVMDGRDLKNLKGYFDSKKFKGTIVK